PHRERVAAEVNVQHQARLTMDLVEGQHLAAAVTTRRGLSSAACIAVVEDDKRGGVAVVDVVLVREPGDGITGGEGEVSVEAQAHTTCKLASSTSSIAPSTSCRLMVRCVVPRIAVSPLGRRRASWSRLFIGSSLRIASWALRAPILVSRRGCPARSISRSTSSP